MTVELLVQAYRHIKCFKGNLLDNQTVTLLSFHNLQDPEMPTNLPVPILHDSYNSPDKLLVKMDRIIM